MIIEPEKFYNEEELQELSDSNDIEVIPVHIVDMYGEERTLNCFIDVDLLKFYEEEYTDEEYHYAVASEDSELIEDIVEGKTIEIIFDNHGNAIYKEN